MLLKAILVTLSTCVNAKMDAKINGGSFASIIDFPHVVFLQGICHANAVANESSWLCGSSIINQRVLITAAHCLEGCERENDNNDPDMIQAVAGTDNYHKPGPNGVYMLTVAKNFKQHEKWNFNNPVYDIGIVALKQDLTFGKYTKRVIVPIKFPDVKIARVAGWGQVDDELELSDDQLKYVEQRISHHGICKTTKEDRICAESVNHRMEWPSVGDSGSGLVTADFTIIGIISFRLPGYPTHTFFTNITYYYDWIVSNSKQLYCSGE